MSDTNQVEWYSDQSDEDDTNQSGISEYDLTSSPNDFNINTIYSYIYRGAIKIPAFQRNYVWDIKRASALIESIIIGLPIPQIFLYETAKNNYIVIDGQQRLMSIYYFIRKRFPRMERRAQLRQILQESGSIPDSIISNEEYFSNFNLNLPSRINGTENPLNKKNYDTLGDDRFQFEMKTIRNVIIRQNRPDDDSSVYEIFNRLNASGVTLTAQEIRMSLYHSDFYRMLERVNSYRNWRALLGIEQPDLNMKDVEIILRGFAMSMRGSDYAPSMTRFLNKFSKDNKHTSDVEITRMEKIFKEFVDIIYQVDPTAFTGQGNKRFNISTFDAVMTAVCRGALLHDGQLKAISINGLQALKQDEEFKSASQLKTASKKHVEKRLERAEFYLGQ